MPAVWAIVAGTPVWVWPTLALVLYLGVTALRPGRRSLARLSVAPGIFLMVSLGTLLVSARLADVLPFWLAGSLLGAAIGAMWASLLRIDVDPAHAIVMPGTAFWLVVGLLLFGMRYAVGVSLALDRSLAEQRLWIALPHAFAGLGTGMSAGWWAVLMMRYRRALR